MPLRLFRHRYSANLLAAKKKGIEKNMITGGGMGMTYFVIYCSYCLAFWYGGKLVREEEMNVGSMLTVSIEFCDCDRRHCVTCAAHNTFLFLFYTCGRGFDLCKHTSGPLDYMMLQV
jgi:hypothetical protein